MKKLIITLSILIILLGANILTNSIQVYAAESNNKPLHVYMNSTVNNYECYEEVNKENIDNNYKNNLLDYKYNEVITYVTNSLYNPLSNKYINYCKTEDDEIYTFYSDQSLFNKWLVLIIDTKGNSNIKDDEVINSYNLDDYIFSDN